MYMYVRTSVNSLLLDLLSFPQSPFPEFKGYFEKENHHTNLSDVKTSLKFSDVSPDSTPLVATHSPSVPKTLPNLLRPSELLEIQKQLTPKVTRQQPRAEVTRQQQHRAENISRRLNLPENGES